MDMLGKGRWSCQAEEEEEEEDGSCDIYALRRDLRPTFGVLRINRSLPCHFLGGARNDC